MILPKYSLVYGFLHTDGRAMKNGRGEEILLKGWAAGNWTNPEGFLCGDTPRPWSADDAAQPPGRFDRARSMEASLSLLCGNEYAASFWPQWYRNHLGEADIRSMASYGYNSIRLPLNARAFLPEEPGYHWNEDSFRMLDQVLDWCEQYQLYAILDLHTTPGGQSGIKCDDGIDYVPRLFLEEESMERTIRLWEKIASRYKNRWIVGGYDLLNEPLASHQWFSLIPVLSSFYDRLIKRIRLIDKNHMLTLEGAGAATNMEIFNHNYDPVCSNWCIHVHYYRLSPEIRSLYSFLEPSLRLNVPVWLGEGGGNVIEIASLLDAAQALGMGYNLWSWKTSVMNNGNLRRDPVQYRLPANWEKITACLNEGAPRPSYKECQAIFDEMLENMKFENCVQVPDQHDYILRRPGRIVPAAAYDSAKTIGASFSGRWDYGNPFDFRTEDRTKLVLKKGCLPPRKDMPFSKPANFTRDPLQSLVLELSMGDYVSYTVRDVTAACNVLITARALTNTDVHISCGDASADIHLEETAGTITCKGLVLEPAMEHTVRICVTGGCLQLECVEFTRTSATLL